jgi:metal iron transporter
MNCPSRTDPDYPEGWNQNPNALNADATTNADFDHMANAKLQRDHRIDPADATTGVIEPTERDMTERPHNTKPFDGQRTAGTSGDNGSGTLIGSPPGDAGRGNKNWRMKIHEFPRRGSRVLLKYAKFIGPGFMVSVAYIDPGPHARSILSPPLCFADSMFQVIMRPT